MKKTGLTSCLCGFVNKAHFCDAVFEMMDESGVGNGFCDKGGSG